MRRTYVRVRIQMDAQWRVGAWESSADAIETLRDLLNDVPLLPGTSVAGGLKHHAGDEDGDRLFGPSPGSGPTRSDGPPVQYDAPTEPAESGDSDAPGEAEKGPKAKASPWWVLGTVVHRDARIGTRRRVRIDRRRGAADSRGLFEVDEVEPVSGDDVIVYFRHEDSKPGQSDREPPYLLGPFLEVLKTWQPQIGGGLTTGLGRGRVTEIRYRTLDLDEKRDVLALLSTGNGTAVERIDALLHAGEQVDVATADPEVLLTAAVSVEYLAQPVGHDSQTRGSAWKGILRSRVEYIARSLGLPACGGDEQSAAGWEDAVYEAFGSTERRGAWDFACSPWAQHTSAAMTRVAIDRFTGGARDGALFTQHYEKDVRMTLTIYGKPLEGENSWVNAALLHALRDLDDGLITIGPKGASGFGMATLSEVTFGGRQYDLEKLPPVTQEVSA